MHALLPDWWMWLLLLAPALVFGFSFGSNRSTQGPSQSGTNYPTDFQNQFLRQYGPGYSNQDLARTLPTTTSLIGGQQVGITDRNAPVATATPAAGPPSAGTQQAAVQNAFIQGGYATPTTPATATPAAESAVQTGGAPAILGGGNVQAPTPTAPSATVSQPAILGGQPTPQPTRTGISASDLWQEGRSYPEFVGILGKLRAKGVDLNNIQPGDLTGISDTDASAAANILNSRATTNNIGTTGTPNTVDAAGGIARTGLGEAAPDYAARYEANRAKNPTPTIIAGPAQAAQANIAPGGFDALQQAAFHGLYDPAAREINRQGELTDARSRAEAAGAGLGASASGQAQVQQQRADRSRQLQGLASDAANQAVTQRYGLEFQQLQANAERQQQTNLANANLDVQAQTANAGNVLSGRLQDSAQYLQALGLNEQAASTARNQFLQLLGLQEADLQRLDQFQLSEVSALLNNYLQTWSATSQTGQGSTAAGGTAHGSDVKVL